MQSIFVLQLVPTDPWQDKHTGHSFYQHRTSPQGAPEQDTGRLSHWTGGIVAKVFGLCTDLDMETRQMIQSTTGYTRLSDSNPAWRN